jgi:hypothetical protein
VGTPEPSVEYWHIGESHTRFGTDTSLSSSGVHAAAVVTITHALQVD